MYIYNWYTYVPIYINNAPMSHNTMDLSYICIIIVVVNPLYFNTQCKYTSIYNSDYYVIISIKVDSSLCNNTYYRSSKIRYTLLVSVDN